MEKSSRKSFVLTGINPNSGISDRDFTSLKNVLEEVGHTTTSKIGPQTDAVICVDYSMASRRLLATARQKGIKTFLIANEPAVVIPEHGSPKIVGLFTRSFFVGRPGGQDSINWPQSWLANNLSKERLDRVVLINSDKWSFNKGSLYGLRVAVSERTLNMDVYGRGWEQGSFLRLAHRVFEFQRTLFAGQFPQFAHFNNVLTKPRNYVGNSKDKIETMSKYKVALVIENSEEFMSEKLFDAFFSGCIPVYVGPDVNLFSIPRNLVIQTRPNIGAILEGIKAAMKMDWDEHSQNVSKFIESSDVQRIWEGKSVLKELVSRIILEMQD